MPDGCKVGSGSVDVSGMAVVALVAEVATVTGSWVSAALMVVVRVAVAVEAVIGSWVGEGWDGVRGETWSNDK